MSNETGSSNFSSGDASSQEAADFVLWEQELSVSDSAHLAIELGDTALGQLVTMERPPDTYPLEEYLHFEKPPSNESKSPEQATSRSGDFRLTGDEMCQIALGLIYFTTGVPADEVYK